MILPISGRTIIIDDKIDEALPIIQLLSKHKVPVTYYSGFENDLPESHIEGIRLVISDLMLTEGVTEIKSIMSHLNKIISKLIAPNNGPYILLIWTKHSLSFEEAKEYIDEKFIVKPIEVFNLQKDLCIEKQGEGYIATSEAMKIIEDSFSSILHKSSAQHLFILWENLAHKSAAYLVSNFAALDDSGNWNKKMEAAFFALARGLGGKQVNCMKTDAVAKYSLLTFTNTFIDVLENNIRRYKNFGEVNLDENEQIRNAISSKTFEIDPKTVASINSMLMLEDINELDLEHRPGNLYVNEINTELKQLFGKMVFDSSNPDAIESEALKRLQNHAPVEGQQKRTQNSFEKEIIKEIKENAKLCLLEISPLCDYTQKKWEVHRVIR